MNSKANRTPEERMADEFDLRLFNLIRTAQERRGDPKWAEVARLLRAARVKVREKMHPKDRSETA